MVIVITMIMSMKNNMTSKDQKWHREPGLPFTLEKDISIKFK